jgi:hypothetical protein
MGKSFEENLGMGEWAPLPPCRSSATPSRLLYPYAIHMGGVLDANDSYLYSVDANDYRLCLVMRMIFIWIKGRCVLSKGVPYHFKGLYIRAVNALPYVCLYVQSNQRFGGFLYLRGFGAGLVNRLHAPNSCNCPLYFPLYIGDQWPRVLGFLFVRVL